MRETIQNGVSYDTIEPETAGDDSAPIGPRRPSVPMGAIAPFGRQPASGLAEQGLGGPVPWENIGGRAEFITFSLDGTTQLTAPSTWFSAFRSGRAGGSLRTDKE